MLYLARHGQTAWNRVARFQGDPDLDQVGYLNRLSLWLLLKDTPLQTIFTSTKLRTQRTAALVAKQHKLPIWPRAALDEIASGVLEGICYQYMQPDTHKPGAKDCDVPARGSRPALAKKAVARIWAKVRSKGLEGRVPLGESYGDMVKRLQPFIPELKAALTRGNVLAVGHGVINRVLLHVLLGWPLKTVYKIHQENDQVYRIAGLVGGTKKLSIALYTPGHGWRPCAPPREGQRHLDCSPPPDEGPGHDAAAKEQKAVQAVGSEASGKAPEESDPSSACGGCVP